MEAGGRDGEEEASGEEEATGGVGVGKTHGAKGAGASHVGKECSAHHDSSRATWGVQVEIIGISRVLQMADIKHIGCRKLIF